MHSIRRHVTSAGWVAPTRALVRVVHRTPTRGRSLGIPGPPDHEDRSPGVLSATAPRALIVGVPRAILEDRYEGYVTRQIRGPMDKLIAWGVTILAIGMAVGYQLLRDVDRIASVIRRHRS